MKLSEVRKNKMEVEITETKQNQLLRRTEVFFTLKHGGEGAEWNAGANTGASPSREESRIALIKALKCRPNLLVIDKMRTEFGKRETVGYAKVYEREERLKEIEREYIIKRNFGDG